MPYSIAGIKDLLALRKTFGDTTKIWITEFGWSTHITQTGAPVWEYGVDESTQAIFLADAIKQFKTYPEIEAAFWFTIRDLATKSVHMNGYGLLRSDMTQKPAFSAMAKAVIG
jgi:hypothetical protein